MQATTIKNNHTDHQHTAAHMPDQWVAVTNQDEEFHTQCSTSMPLYGLWVLLQATTILSPLFVPQISGIFWAAKTEALHFHLKTGSGSEGLQGITKASVEAYICVEPQQASPSVRSVVLLLQQRLLRPSVAGLGGRRASCLLVGMRRARSAHVSDATRLPRKHSAEWNNKFKNVFCHLTSLLIPGSARDLDLHGNHRLLRYNTGFLC